MHGKTVDVEDVPGQFKDLLGRVMAGERIVLHKDNKPVAEMTPVIKRRAGLHAGAICTSGDFDEELPEKFWSGEM